MNSRRHTLAGCVAVALAASLAPMVVQAEGTATSNSNELEAVNVSALPLGSGSPSTPYSVMDQQTLTQKNAATLGETLNNQPGVHSDTFGGGASRPVIRGQSGPRVGVLNDGSAVLDASSISPDHTVTVDPMLARQIEVLRGPSTLLYGSGASGGNGRRRIGRRAGPRGTVHKDADPVARLGKRHVRRVRGIGRRGEVARQKGVELG